MPFAIEVGGAIRRSIHCRWYLGRLVSRLLSFGYWIDRKMSPVVDSCHRSVALASGLLPSMPCCCIASRSTFAQKTCGISSRVAEKCRLHRRVISGRAICILMATGAITCGICALPRHARLKSPAMPREEACTSKFLRCACDRIDLRSDHCALGRRPHPDLAQDVTTRSAKSALPPASARP